ncbi:uncharacterized protein [Rhodnius prolixus]|uniref:Uncharacterized protein n=2 Tax=Rhodnius TaxID=13248 RepID=T1HWA5_RHOPR
MYYAVLFLLLTTNYGLCSEHDSPLFEAARLLMQNAGSKEAGDIGGLASSLIKGLDPSLLAGMLEQVSGNDGNENSNDGGGSGPLDLIASLAPLLLQQQGHKHSEDPSLEDVEGHEQFDRLTSLLPTVIQQIWEALKSSGAWGEIWEKSGLGQILGLFNGPEGRLRLEAAVRSLENHQFRKKWLKSMVAFVMEYVKQLADPGMQKRYASNTASFINTMLRSQGYKPNELFIKGQPFEESLIRVIDLFCQRNFGMTVDSAKYIRPAAKYFNDLVGVGRGGAAVSTNSIRETEDKLADMINQEVLEGILRVWQAHKYTVKHHRCDKYLLCVLNRPGVNARRYTVRPVVTKAASIVSAWFLSGQTGSSFLSLYDAVVENYDCQTEFPADCMGFHEEDNRFTTEYAHNEL